MSKPGFRNQERRFTNIVFIRTAMVVDMAYDLAAMVRMQEAHYCALHQLLRLLLMYRRDADDCVEYLLRSRGIVAKPRFTPLDYAAGVVAAAVRFSTAARTATAVRLAQLIGVCPDLVKCVRDALLSEFAVTVPPRYQPFSFDELVRSRAREEGAATQSHRSRMQMFSRRNAFQTKRYY